PSLSAHRPGLRPVPRSFYARPSLDVARDLLGRLLVRRVPGATLVARLVECEAYMEGDPASDSYRGRTARTEVMFGPPGHLYVYFTYGMHHCMNVVTGRDGEGSAVLLRAAQPMEGLDWMGDRRGVLDPRRLCAGPARLARAFDVDRAQNGMDLVGGGDLFVSEAKPFPDDAAGVAPGVGTTLARDGPGSLFEIGRPFASRGPAARLGRGLAPATGRSGSSRWRAAWSP